jgi:Lon protease-like protein
MLAVLVGDLPGTVVESFSTASRLQQHQQHRPSCLHGISEWRDLVFDYPGTGDDRRLGTESTGPPKEICILPFPFEDVLLQGETKQLRLYEERFLKLFDYCMEHHEGVVAMGLLAETGIIQTVPLCEIEAFNRLEGFGIFVTIRVVGRAQLDEILQQTPYLKAVCRELNDEIPPNLELPNLLASNIENHLLLLSNMEAQLAKADTNETDSDDSEEAKEMLRRIQVAKLVRNS